MIPFLCGAKRNHRFEPSSPPARDCVLPRDTNAGIFRRKAYYVDKILRGAKPADLPVEQPTRFEFLLNLKTSKVLGLTLFSTLLALADEVIE
jgi:hypothetical protein